MSIASGEWWIDDSGMAQYADGDVGDQNHEGMALQAILSEHGIDVEDPETPELWPGHITKAEEKWLVKHGMPKNVAKALQEAADIRELMIEWKGWMRIAGSAVELWEWNQAALDTLRGGIYEAWGGDDWDTLDPEELDFDVMIEEASTRRTFAVPLKALMDDRMDAESLKRLGAKGEIVQAPSAPELRAAWARKAARERGVEENPHAREHFHLLGSTWDVGKAWDILEAKPRAPKTIDTEPLKWFAPLIKTDPKTVTKADLTVPIIVAIVKMKKGRGAIPIDGWHRITRALKEGLTELPAYVLTAKETDKVTLR